MGNYHPIINIDINKGYIIRAYNDKPAEYVADKVRELSEDKTGWSNKVMFAVSKIIHCNEYNLPDDLFIVLNNSTKTMNISLDRPMQDYKRDELIEKMRTTLDKLPDDEDDTAASIYEVYLGLNGKYQVFDDITMAQLILLLSERAYPNLSKEDIMRLHSKIIPYIDSMNELIDGTRLLPK